MALGVVLTTSLPTDVVGSVKDTQLIDTPYGVVEQQLLSVGSDTVVAIRRSTGPSWRPPHEVNFRANMFSFAAAGVACVLGTNIVGSLHPEIPPGTIVVPDQFLDFTRRRLATIFDRYGHRHVDVSEPFCGRLRTVIARSAGGVSAHVKDRGTYVAVDGPRYETRAEVTAYGRLGGDVVGMTCATEAVMARELGLCYASVALVSNYGAGIADDRLDAAEMIAAARQIGDGYRAVVRRVVSDAVETTVGGCCATKQPSTHPSWRSLMLRLTDPDPATT